MVRKLKEDPYYIVAVFEEVGLPVEDRLSKNDRVFYLESGRLAETLSGFVGNRQGCWIFKNNNESTSANL